MMTRHQEKKAHKSFFHHIYNRSAWHSILERCRVGLIFATEQWEAASLLVSLIAFLERYNAGGMFIRFGCMNRVALLLGASGMIL